MITDCSALLLPLQYATVSKGRTIKIQTLRIHKVCIYKAIYLLYQFYGCERYFFYFVSRIRSFDCRLESIYRISETICLAIFNPQGI